MLPLANHIALLKSLGGLLGDAIEGVVGRVYGPPGDFRSKGAAKEAITRAKEIQRPGAPGRQFKSPRRETPASASTDAEPGGTGNSHTGRGSEVNSGGGGGGR